MAAASQPRLPWVSATTAFGCPAGRSSRDLDAERQDIGIAVPGTLVRVLTQELSLDYGARGKGTVDTAGQADTHVLYLLRSRKPMSNEFERRVEVRCFREAELITADADGQRVPPSTARSDSGTFAR